MATLALCFLLPAAVVFAVMQVKQRSYAELGPQALVPTPLPPVVQWHLEDGRLRPDGRYQVWGWVVEHAKEPRWLKARVVLVNAQRDRGLALATNMVLRPDVSAAVGDGRTDHRSGFSTEVLAPPVDGGGYHRIYLAFERDMQRLLVDTGRSLRTRPDAP